MRIIPGNTKVKIEIFQGISLWDILVAAIGSIMLACIVVSTLPYKLVFIIVHVFIFAVMLSRIDKEANYMYLLHIIRHFGFKRNFDRQDTDEILMDIKERGSDAVAIDEIFREHKEKAEQDELEEFVFSETKEEKKARLKREKEEYKKDTKLLKSGKLSKEEEDAIWLKRANQSKQKKTDKTAASKGKKQSREKWADIKEVSAFSDIKDGYIVYGKNRYFGVVVEIEAVEFKFFSNYRRTNTIENALGSVLRSMNPDLCMNMVKIERPVNYDHYSDFEMKKLDDLRAAYENGLVNEEELKSRVSVIYDRIYALRKLKDENKVVTPFYYLVFFDSDKKRLNNSVTAALDSLKLGEMPVRQLKADKEIAVFLKYVNDLDFDERDIEKIRPEDYAKWAMPDTIQFTPRTTVVNGMATHNFRVVGFPTTVGDAWLASLMTYPSTKVIVKMKPMDSSKAIRAIDKSLAELRGKVATAKTDSEAMDAQLHLETLQLLLSMLQSDNETLLDVNIYVTAYDAVLTHDNPKLPDLKKPTYRFRITGMKKTVRRVWKEAGFSLNNMEFNQALAYIGGQVSGYDPMADDGRGLPSNTVAAAYPWVFPHIMDEEGIQLGTADGVPVFVDFFRRDHERVNSNMVIVGKSGSGKSFATKSILSNLAADGAKIFLLDPEGEYTNLAKNLNGKFINVANAKYGRLNPFHIITTLDDEEGDEGESSSYANHLQFLEEFFRQILPDCEKDALEYLNTLVDRVYSLKGITPLTDLTKLKPEDYPIFDDLYDEVLREFQRTDSEYIKGMLRTLMNYVSKFSEGGRNSIIWNGPSSITTDENFTVFNFQNLLANRNSTIANAQMLLVLKYIDNEIIKNRDYNEKFGLNRKIVVVIDEAHVFIDTKFPVALDFMFQLAKRIRKYNGMQIVITQNIKDFVGSEEIARKSTAIINACQYSFIFSLAPNDMSDLCTLYEKAGGINENEQEQIIQAPRGRAFVVLSANSRTSFKCVVPDNVKAMFSQNEYVNPYFVGEGGDENWADYIQDSNEKRAQNLLARGVDILGEEEEEDSFSDFGSSVSFEEISAEEYEETKPEIKEEPAVIFEETKEKEEEEFVALKQQYAPSVMLANQGILPEYRETSSKTEELLADLVNKLGTSKMSDDLRNAVREEVEKAVAARVAQMMPVVTQAAASAPASAMTAEPAALAASEEVPDSFASMFAEGEEETEEDSFALPEDFFAEVDEEGEETEDSEEAVALGSIFDFAKLSDLDDAEEEAEGAEEGEESGLDEEILGDEDAEDGDHFDIMSFLANQAEEDEQTGESDETIEDFINGSETKLDVTLEQLIAYTRRVKQNQK